MTMEAIRIAIVGLGKIAHDRHIPSLRYNPGFEIVATVSADGAALDDVPSFETIEALIASGIDVDAVSLCTPPQVRHALAATALAHGLHTFLEKPPAASVSQAKALASLAAARGVTVFAGWHSRFAAYVAPARQWLAGRTIHKATITWREDVRVWHPGQAWIWQPGGLGVFDPGINALSIATHILPGPLALNDSSLEVPTNRCAPIAARLCFATLTGAPVEMDLDWRQTGPQSWDIAVETDAGTLMLSKGGAELSLPGEAMKSEDHEYCALYARFASLIQSGESELDVSPLQLVADAFLRGRVIPTDPFYD